MPLHKEILTKKQSKLLPLIKEFSENFILVGGTAIALLLGRRQSVDFDLFTTDDFDNGKIKRKIARFFYKIDKTFISAPGEYTILINVVKITFFQYPYEIKAVARLDKTINLPDLLTLAAMKAFTLRFQGKWKDYIDLYFILKNHYSLKEISKKGQEIFGGEFNERIFLEALAYFKDINYTEKIIYFEGFETDDEAIKKSLIDFSLH